MELRSSVSDFLTAVLSELNETDAAGMFVFLTGAIKGNPGKLGKIASKVKDPKVLKDLQEIATAKTDFQKMTKAASLYKTFKD